MLLGTAVMACALSACSSATSAATATPVPTALPAATASPAPTEAPAGDQADATPTAAPAAAQADDTVQVFFIKSGKSDAILITSAGCAYLVDTGTEESVPAILGAMHLIGVEALDGILITHTHSDHVGGLSTLLSAFPCGAVYRAAISQHKKDGSNVIDDAALDAGFSTVLLNAGDTLSLGGDAILTVLGPLALNEDDDNDNSLVLMLTAGGTRCLLTGDMQFAEEASLLAAGTDFEAAILKVGNHGNPDATSEAFAYAVDPAIVVFTTDRSVDEDTANERVRELFPNARQFITDETVQGVLVTIGTDGTVSVTEPVAGNELPVTISAVDEDGQVLTLTNPSGEDQDLSGCMLSTGKSGAFFCFPSGTILPAGQSLTVGGSKADADFSFPVKKPFSGKQYDGVTLFDAYGNEACFFPAP